MSGFSQSECVAWFTAFLTTSVINVAFNVITILVFISTPQLCKRNTYLMINLALVDLLVGGVTGTRHVVIRGKECGLWPWQPSKTLNFIISMLALTFPVASLESLAVISIERLLATVRPFKHRYVSKWLYAGAVVTIWLTALMTGLSITLLVTKTSGMVYLYTWTVVNLLSLIAICVSYAIIVVKVRYSRNLPRSDCTARERKLTTTLLVVTVVSILTWLPRIIQFYVYFFNGPSIDISSLSFQRTSNAFLLAYLANSFVNPVLYAVRMPEFVRGLNKLFCCREFHPRGNAVLPLSERTYQKSNL